MLINVFGNWFNPNNITNVLPYRENPDYTQVNFVGEGNLLVKAVLNDVVKEIVLLTMAKVESQRPVVVPANAKPVKPTNPVKEDAVRTNN